MNGARQIAQTIASILAQQGVTFDLLISDDRSDDDTLEIARSLAGDRLRVVVNSERLGLAGNWNQCVSLSRTPLVAIVHQDDVLRPGHLAAHVQAFQADAGVGLVASASGVIDASGAEVAESVVGRGGLGPTDRTFAPGEALAAMAAGNPLRCSAVSIRAAAHADVGGFDPALRYIVDWDFWLRVARRWKLAWLAAPTVDVRWHEASETHRFKTGTTDLEETERLLNDLLGWLREQSLPTAGVASEARRRLARAYLHRAYAATRVADGRLARTSLARAVRLWPGVARTVAADPRLAARLTAACLAPALCARWLGESHAPQTPVPCSRP
jgi:glycosyltransferase involved in cell wall biosynthesis